MAVFQKWNAAFEQVISAIDHYRDTLIALEAAIESPHEQFPDPSVLEETILSLYDRHTTIKSKTNELYEANFCLGRILNRSKKQVPINTLPPEILVRIFTIACGSSCFSSPELSVFGSSIRSTPQTLLALTQVCSAWRRIMIDIPSLWSHIDIYRSRRDSGCMIPNSSLWLDRARNRPLSVHISSYSPLNNMSRAHLGPIFPRFTAATSLSIGPTESASWVISMLSLWITSVKLGNLRSLTVLGSDGAVDGLELQWPHRTPVRETLEAFFAPICSLRLRNAYFDWDSPVYHGLVELKISVEDDEVSITCDQMVTILNACPELRVLQLEGMEIEDEPEDSFDPIPLRKLQVLDVARMTPESLENLLQYMAPGPGELSVRVDLQYQQAGIEALQSFFSRSKVVRLFLQGSYGSRTHQVDLTKHLTSLNDLRVLLFDPSNALHLFSEKERLNALVEVLGRPSATRFPHLRTLYLLNSELGAENINEVFEPCGIQELNVLSSHKGSKKGSQTSLARKTMGQFHVDPEALVESWYEYMW